MKTSLCIRGLELSVRLGWPDNERKDPQTIHMDIDITFHKPPKACETDNLADTYCYGELSNKIREELSLRNIHLIEHLSDEIYRIVKGSFMNEANVTVRIYKYPKIEGLTGGVCFSYGDN